MNFKKLVLPLIISVCFIAGCTSTDTNPSGAISSDSKVESSFSSEAKSGNSKITTGQKNAMSSAKMYLGTMAFSHQGLIKQLEFDKYSTEDATYAADNCGADWNEQAAKSAKAYLDTMPFSRDSLIDQLKFDGYTQEQAEHGATENGY